MHQNVMQKFRMSPARKEKQICVVFGCMYYHNATQNSMNIIDKRQNWTEWLSLDNGLVKQQLWKANVAGVLFSFLRCVAVVSFLSFLSVFQRKLKCSALSVFTFNRIRLIYTIKLHSANNQINITMRTTTIS